MSSSSTTSQWWFILAVAVGGLLILLALCYLCFVVYARQKETERKEIAVVDEEPGSPAAIAISSRLPETAAAAGAGRAGANNSFASPRAPMKQTSQNSGKITPRGTGGSPSNSLNSPGRGAASSAIGARDVKIHLDGPAPAPTMQSIPVRITTTAAGGVAATARLLSFQQHSVGRGQGARLQVHHAGILTALHFTAHVRRFCRWLSSCSCSGGAPAQHGVHSCKRQCVVCFLRCVEPSCWRCAWRRWARVG